MYCPECGTRQPDDHTFCRNCGASLPNAPAGKASTADDTATARAEESPASRPSSGVRSSGGQQSQTQPQRSVESARGTHPGGVSLGSAEAVDIACQHCGQRPIEEVAKGYRVTGFLLAFQVKTYRLVGCHRCLRAKLWGLAGRNLVLGWWSIGGLLLTPFLTLYDFARGLRNRGPNRNLTETLETAGIDYALLADRSQFDPAEHTQLELYLRGMVRLACAVMMADGRADPEERDAIRETTLAVFPDYPPDKVDDLIDRHARPGTDVETIAEGLGDMLTPEGKQQVIAFVARVVDAGVKTHHDVELASRIATAMDLDEDDVTEALSTPSETPQTMAEVR